MAKLTIHTPLNRVILVGEYNNWDICSGWELTKDDRKKAIVVDAMPRGEYRLFSCRTFDSGEVYPNGRQMANRYFDGTVNEVIVSKFIKENK